MDVKKRLLIFFCTVVLTVSAIAIPAFALTVGDEYIFTYNSTLNTYVNFDMPTFKLGDYLAFDLYFSTDGEEYGYWASLSGEFIDYSAQFGEGAIGFQSGERAFGQAASPFGGLMSVLLPVGGSSDLTAKIVITSLTKQTAINAINNAFNTLILWVSMVVSGVVSGPMNDLLLVFAIGVAITFVVVSVKIIRKFIWGA